jgi:outer membrane protein assembly factor BamA
MEMMKLLMRMR